MHLIRVGNRARSGVCVQYDNKVTGVNIFSSALSVRGMEKMTSEMSEGCGKDGDYLAWDNIVWTLKGSAALADWQKDDICSEPMIHIFNKLATL